MVEDIKKDIKKIARDTEAKVTESILRWRYKKEGKKIPEDQNIESQSRVIAEQAHQILSKRGKNIWNELKSVYRKGQKREDSKD